VIPPLLRDFPDHFETERLLIRAPRAGDGKTINEAVLESLEKLKPWLPWATKAPPVDETEEFVRRGAATFILREDLPMLIFRKEDGIYLGGIGLHRIHWDVPAFEIGYWLRTSAHSNGYMIEAVNGMTKFGFEVLNAERMEIRCDTRNEKSAAVARRAGYQQEALFRRDARDTSGNLRDTYVFAMIRSDYEGRQF
jgi:RimJ/RimL family protein N-acetyltransferase